MIKKSSIILACVFFLSPLTFALPQQQTVTGNLNYTVNGQKTQFLFKNGDEELGQLTIKTASKRQTFPLQELPYQRSYHIYFNDYNFDGYTDIAVSAPDMGMGVYAVFDIFLYQPKSKDYQVLDQSKIDFSHAQCSILADLKLIPQKKQMTSSCRGGARWWVDTFEFKHGQWKWLKSKAEDE